MGKGNGTIISLCMGKGKSQFVEEPEGVKDKNGVVQWEALRGNRRQLSWEGA